ncbi:hypothetical protein V8F20_004205 [Naviculisporaceae sp. PSN 640]
METPVADIDSTAVAELPQGTDQIVNWFRFPANVRNRIYRLLLTRDEPIEQGRWVRDLSAQLLRTCRAVYKEGMPILYGENTFVFKAENTWGPHYSNELEYHIHALRHAFTPKVSKHNRTFYPPRRFHVEIRYTPRHGLNLLRENVQHLVDIWVRILLPKTSDGCFDFLGLNCDLDCEDESGANFRNECWDNYKPDGNEVECVDMLRARFCVPALRGKVKKVVITGLHDYQEHAEAIRQYLMTSATDGTTVASNTAVPLLDKWDRLNLHAHSLPPCEEDLRLALRAAELGDAPLFKECKDRIIRVARALWEALEQDELLQEA